MLTTQEVYAAARALPLPERLRLAALLLDEVSHPSYPIPNAQDLPNYSSIWTEEDRRDFAAHTARYAASELPDDDDLLPPTEEWELLKAEEAHA